MLTRWRGALSVEVFCRAAGLFFGRHPEYMDLTRSLAIFHITVNQYAIYGYKRIIGMVYSGAAPVAAARLRVGLIGATWTLGKPNIRSFCSISCGQRDNSVILRGPSVPRRRWLADDHEAEQVDGAGPVDRRR